MLNAIQNYPLLQKMHSNFFKCFITQAWWLGSCNGISGFLHLDGIYDDPKGGQIRCEVYTRLRYHFQFYNELKFFPIGNVRRYSINIYKSKKQRNIFFSHISNLFHPITIDESFNHSGLGSVPGIKDSNFNWELRGHRNRIIEVNENSLKLFAILYDKKGTHFGQARLPMLHSLEILNVLEKFVKYPFKLGDLDGKYYPTEMFNETGAQKKGIIKRETKFPSDLRELIISGPHISVSNPLYQTPNEGCGSHRDYSLVDLIAISSDYIPRTNYVPLCTLDKYIEKVPKWNGNPVINYYRIAFRNQLSPSGERTLISAIIPPHVGHIDGCFSICLDDYSDLALFCGLTSSIVLDFWVKTTGKAHIRHDIAVLLPIIKNTFLDSKIMARALRLNCLTTPYAEFWNKLYDTSFAQDGFVKKDSRLKTWNGLTPKWGHLCAFRSDYERRQALVELDVLAALALGLTIEELVTIYKVQFPVLQKYETQRYYDQLGMLVPKDVLKNHLGLELEDEEELDEEGNPLPKPKSKSKSKPRTKSKQQPADPLQGFIPPFDRCDREADMRQAYAHFEKLLAGEKA